MDGDETCFVLFGDVRCASSKKRKEKEGEEEEGGSEEENEGTCCAEKAHCAIDGIMQWNRVLWGGQCVPGRNGVWAILMARGVGRGLQKLAVAAKRRVWLGSISISIPGRHGLHLHRCALLLPRILVPKSSARLF